MQVAGGKLSSVHLGLTHSHSDMKNRFRHNIGRATWGLILFGLPTGTQAVLFYT